MQTCTLHMCIFGWSSIWQHHMHFSFVQNNYHMHGCYPWCGEQCVMHLILTMKKLIIIDRMFCKIISHNSVVVDFGLQLGKYPPCCLLAYCCKFGICYIKATNTRSTATSFSSIWAIPLSNSCHHRTILLQPQNDQRRQRS